MKTKTTGFVIFFVCLAIQYSFGQRELKQVMYLSGTDNENTRTWEFYCTEGRKSGKWTTIEVPSCWEQQGFGFYNYGRDYHTYGKKFQFANEKGIYRYSFSLPSHWKNREIYLVFEGVMTDAEVLINGVQAGEIHQGAFYRFEYNITSLVKPSDNNLLEVRVSKMSANESVNRAERYADYWIFGGIFRPVYLESFPKEHIHRSAIAADAAGNFIIDVFPENLISDRTIKITIFDAKDKIVTTASTSARAGDSLVRITAKVNNPLLWTAETPNLYYVLVELTAKKAVLYKTREKFGFRTIEVRPGDGIYLNGVKIKMKGINRHCIWPETGRTLNYSINLMDVKLMREMNMNAVRCSHYPPDVDFLNLCDSLGLYVLDELAGWQNAYDTAIGEKLVKEMVFRDVNHPSVIFWSNGNEGGTNKALDDDFGKYDPSGRPVIHAHHRPGNAFNHIDCNHYENYYSCINILKDSLIYMPTEFLHCQEDGGGGAGLYDFWNLMLNEKRSAGGFLWALLDEGIARTDMNGVIDVNRVNANDGVLGPHRQKEGSYYAIKEIFSPVRINLESLPEDFDGMIEVENQYNFTSLNQCRFQLKLAEFTKPWEKLNGYVIKFENTFKGPGITPGTRGKLKLELPVEWKEHDVLFLTVYAPNGEEIYTWSWKIRKNKSYIDNITSLPGTNKAEASVGDTTIIISASGISATIDKKTGKLIKINNRFGNALLFGNGPVLCYGTANLKEIRHYPENDNYIIESLFEGNLEYTRWKMHSNGWLSLEYKYTLQGEVPYAGISFDYPESNIIGARWLGKGPVRVWKNRQHGVSYNVWESLYNNTHTGQEPWNYPEFKGYFADICWMEINTTEGKFLIASEQENLFVRLFDFYSLSGIKPHPDLPPGDISFLDCIPPTGTKMATRIDDDASVLGPESKMNVLNKPVKRTIYFYFGLLTQ